MPVSRNQLPHRGYSHGGHEVRYDLSFRGWYCESRTLIQIVDRLTLEAAQSTKKPSFPYQWKGKTSQHLGLGRLTYATYLSASPGVVTV